MSIEEASNTAAERERAIAASLVELHQQDTERRALQVALVDAQEDELKAVAVQLNDDTLGAMLTAQGLLHKLRGELDSAEQAKTVGRVDDQLAKAASRLQTLLFDLRPPALDRMGLVATLRAFLEQLRTETGLEFELVNAMERDPESQAAGVLYRVAREAITNVRFHAGASRITVNFSDYGGGHLMKIEDDGRGFDSAASENRSQLPPGFLIMRERCELHDGWWTVSSRPGRGSTVSAWVPSHQAHPTGDGGSSAPATGSGESAGITIS